MMIRVLTAATVANVAGACFFVFALSAHMALTDPDFPGNLGTHLTINFAALLLCFRAVFSTALPASLLVALAGFSFRWRSPWIYLAGGAVIGLGFILWHWGFTFRLLRRPFFYWIMAISLACAWLYWQMVQKVLSDRCERA